ncbi:hypothetical protein BC829DRAFT_491426 [Chytridium lagenaria]|nr:hypothetical protein BC829DRAFT_491426 [Chytridium lagenaria]
MFRRNVFPRRTGSLAIDPPTSTDPISVPYNTPADNQTQSAQDLTTPPKPLPNPLKPSDGTGTAGLLSSLRARKPMRRHASVPLKTEMAPLDVEAGTGDAVDDVDIVTSPTKMEMGDVDHVPLDTVKETLKTRKTVTITLVQEVDAPTITLDEEDVLGSPPSTLLNIIPQRLTFRERLPTQPNPHATVAPRVIDNDEDLVAAIACGVEILPPRYVGDQTPLRRATVQRDDGRRGGRGTVGRRVGTVRKRPVSPLELLSEDDHVDDDDDAFFDTEEGGWVDEGDTVGTLGRRTGTLGRRMTGLNVYEDRVRLRSRSPMMMERSKSPGTLGRRRSRSPLRMGTLGRCGTMRKTVRRDVGEETGEHGGKTCETIEIIKNNDDNDDDDDLFLDAQDASWQDVESTLPKRATTRQRFRHAVTEVVNQVHVSRSFYEVLASRAGEVFSHAGSAAQVLATPASFIAGPAVGGLLSTGGAAAVAAGKAAVKRFGRKHTRNRVAQAHAAISKFTAAKLIEAATATITGEENSESTSVKAFTQGLTATLEGGYVAGTVSLVASGFAASVDEETRKRMLANTYIAAATEALGHLSNVAPILPGAFGKVADAAGNLATAGQGMRVVDDEGSDGESLLEEEEEVVDAL